MTVCMDFGFAAWSEILIANACIWPYKTGLISINDTNILYSGFENAELTNMTHVTKFEESIPLLVGGFLIWHYFATVIAAMVIFVAERTIASFFFSDYERKRRDFIAIGLLGGSQMIAIPVVFLAFIYTINLVYAISIAIFFFSIVFVTFLSLLYYNVNLRNRINLNSGYSLHYSLGARFQVAENARSLELAVRLVVVILIMASFEISLIVVSATGWLRVDQNSALFSLFECIYCLNPLFIAPATMWRIPEWKMAFCRSIPLLQSRIQPTNKVVHRRLSKETDLYFVQLRDSWN